MFLQFFGAVWDVTEDRIYYDSGTGRTEPLESKIAIGHRFAALPLCHVLQLLLTFNIHISQERNLILLTYNC